MTLRKKNVQDKKGFELVKAQVTQIVFIFWNVRFASS